MSDRVYRDPVHGSIAFDWKRERFLIELIDTPEFQRLRRIKQLGAAQLVFQGAEHSRFCHSLGVAFLAKRIIDRLREDPNLPGGLDFEETRKVVLAGGLLHDIGHGPFSHLFERTFSQKNHETWSVEIIDNPDTQVHRVLKEHGLVDSVKKLLLKSYQPRFATDIISSQVDADRLDYLLRDSYMTGVTYGRYDLDWLLEVIELAKIPGNGLGIAVNHKKGFHAAEQFVIGRYLMYQQVYFHRTIRAAERMIKLIFERLVDNAKAGNLPRFCPDAIHQLLNSHLRSISLRAYLRLDDEFMFACFNLWSEDHEDDILKDLCRRLLRRDLFKTEAIDISRISDHLKYTADLKTLQDAMNDAGFDPRYYLASDAAEDLPYKDMMWFIAKDRTPEDIWLAEGGQAKFNLSDPRVSPLIDSLRNIPIAATRLCFPSEMKELVRKHLQPYLTNFVSQEERQLVFKLGSEAKQPMGERI
ncbi:MAG TPA: HD domain-containing protein [Candidatus Acidoferrales bacterium]|nr:HD domain-containing protein [Candidatus Acidoferrales bacterium]